MTDETPQERRSRLFLAKAQLEERRQRVITSRLLLAINALGIALLVVLLRRYGVL